jgi:excisionase family DNA binding protein
VDVTLTLSDAQLAELARLLVPLVRAELAAETSGNGSPWLSVAEAGDYLGVSGRTIERELERRRLRSSTVGRRRLLHRDDLDAFARNGDGRGGSDQATNPNRRRNDRRLVGDQATTRRKL